jgi:hypothetical protein
MDEIHDSPHLLVTLVIVVSGVEAIEMEWIDGLDTTDREILRVLSLYEGLDSLQLWYELGESDGRVDRIAREEILERLEFLGSRGFVEKVTEVGDGSGYAKYRLRYSAVRWR